MTRLADSSRVCDVQIILSPLDPTGTETADPSRVSPLALRSVTTSSKNQVAGGAR